MDTGILARVLDDVLEYGGDYRIESLDLGRQHEDESRGAGGDPGRGRRTARAHRHAGAGARRQPGRPRDGDAPGPRRPTASSPRTSTPRPTSTPSSGSTASGCAVDRAEMDCGLVVEERDGRPFIRNVPVSDVRAGDAVVCGAHGVRVEMPPAVARGEEENFGFMSSAVSSEKPQALLVRQIAERMREVKADGQADPLGRRPGRRAHRRRPGDGPAGAGRLRRRPLRRQRAGHPRHRVLAVRHLARRRPGQGLGRAARARAPHPRDQHHPGGRLDRRGRGVRRAHRRRDARDGARPASRSCWSARCATTARCPTSTPT